MKNSGFKQNRGFKRRRRKNKDISLEERNRNRDFGTSMCDLVGKFSVVSRLFSFKEFLSCIAQS
jgi:hypothetical protein